MREGFLGRATGKGLDHHQPDVLAHAGQSVDQSNRQWSTTEQRSQSMPRAAEFDENRAAPVNAVFGSTVPPARHNVGSLSLPSSVPKGKSVDTRTQQHAVVDREKSKKKKSVFKQLFAKCKLLLCTGDILTQLEYIGCNSHAYHFRMFSRRSGLGGVTCNTARRRFLLY